MDDLLKWKHAQDKAVKEVIAIDFDGVIHKNSKGFHNGKVYDEPVLGAINAIKALSEKYTIILYTFKGHPDRPLIDGKDGITLTKEWLQKYDILEYVEDIVWGKPNAKVYIDDKGYRFENWEDTLRFVDEEL